MSIIEFKYEKAKISIEIHKILLYNTNMEKLEICDELRTVFREIFKYEIKRFTSNVAFLDQIKSYDINQDQLSPDQKMWLTNLGMLTKDTKNLNVDYERTVYSHMISAVYAGYFGLNFVDVTAHCLETIKTKKNLDPNCNLVDHLSSLDIRNLSIAMMNFSNEIVALKNQGQFQYANMSNFYKIADLAFICGVNARNYGAKAKYSDFSINEHFNLKANTILDIIDKNLINQTMSFEDFKIKNLRNQLINNSKSTYIYLNLTKDIVRCMRIYDIKDSNIISIFEALEQGYYKSSYFKNAGMTIFSLFKNSPLGYSEKDMNAQITKLTFFKTLIERFLKTKPRSISLIPDLKNLAYTAGMRAREDCEFKNNTSPEFYSSFIQSYIRDRQDSLLKDRGQNSKPKN